MPYKKYLPINQKNIAEIIFKNVIFSL